MSSFDDHYENFMIHLKQIQNDLNHSYLSWTEDDENNKCEKIGLKTSCQISLQIETLLLKEYKLKKLVHDFNHFLRPFSFTVQATNIVNIENWNGLANALQIISNGGVTYEQLWKSFMDECAECKKSEYLQKNDQDFINEWLSTINKRYTVKISHSMMINSMNIKQVIQTLENYYSRISKIFKHKENSYKDQMYG